jgi:hypothetical protein
MADTLFGSKLDALHPQRMLRTEARPQLLARKFAEAAAPPTNEQILDAAKAAYHTNSQTVDLNTTSGLRYATSSQGHPRVATLNNYNWKSQQAPPITPTAQQVYAAPAMKSAVESATSNPNIWTLVVGISESAQFIIGEEGGIGVAFLLASPTEIKGAAYLAGKLGLDIDVAVNLQLGLWNVKPEGLAGDFYGLEVNLDLEVCVSLGIYLTRSLDFYGFSIGVGVGVGGGATIVGGYTWVF